MIPPLLAMRGITKRFPGVTALENVSLSLAPGEVLALVGENGAGKSTLMKILGGAYPPDEGEIAIDGRPVVLRGIADAKRLGISLIHQELMLAPNLDIAANIFLGNEHVSGGLLKPLPRRRMRARAALLLDRVGLKLSPATVVGTLTAGQMQMVEIAKALSLNARIMIMDEPTSSLSAGESEHLFGIIHHLRAGGIGVIYISHRMDEVRSLSDRISVLRDGRCVGDLSRAQAESEPARIVALMVGREPSACLLPRRPEPPVGPAFFEARDLLVPGAPAPVTFAARRGEILGFAGLVGAGRTELMQTIFGITPARAGSMALEGQPFSPRSAREAIARGVYLAPEDRRRHGLVLPMSVAENTSLPSIARSSRWGRLDRAAERKMAEAEVARLGTKTPDIHRKVVNLSGGNQQKVVLAKWLAMQPRVLILDEPTRGIDVGAKAEIHEHMMALAHQGITILMVSSDLEEVIGVCDRVVVMHERRIGGVLPRDQITPRRIAALMTGAAATGAEA